MFETLRHIIAFHNENCVAVLIDQHQINALCKRCTKRTALNISDSVSKINPEENHQNAIIRGEAMEQTEISSGKMANCLHESQLSDGRTRFLSFDFHYENGYVSINVRAEARMAATHFSLELSLIRHTANDIPHLITHFSYSLIPLYKPFSL